MLLRRCVVLLLLAGVGAGLYLVLPPRPRWTLTGAGHVMLGITSDGNLLTRRQRNQEDFGPIERWHISTGERLGSFLTDQDPVSYPDAWSRSRLAWAVGREVQILDVANGTHVRLPLPEGTERLHALPSPDLEMLAVVLHVPASSKYAGFLTIDIAATKALHRFPEECVWQGFGKDCVLYSQGDKLVAANPRTGAALASFEKPGWPLLVPSTLTELVTIRGVKARDWPMFAQTLGVNIDARGDILVLKEYDGLPKRFHIHSLPSLRVMATFTRSDGHLVVSPDRHWVFVMGGADGRLGELWDLTKLERVATVALGQGQDWWTFRPDSRALVLHHGEPDPKSATKAFLWRELLCLEVPSLAVRWRQSYPAASSLGHVDMHPKNNLAAILLSLPGQPKADRMVDAIDIFDVDTGTLLAHRFGHSPYWPDDRHLTYESFPPDQPPSAWEPWLEKMGIPWRGRSLAHVLDVGTGKDLAAVPTGNHSGVLPILTQDGSILICEGPRGEEPGVCVWDVPPRRRWWWILGAPACLGVAWSGWRRWRERASANQQAIVQNKTEKRNP